MAREVNNDIIFISCTELLMYFYTCFTVIFIAVGLLYLAFAEVTAPNWITAGAILVTCLLVLGGLGLLQLLVEFFNKKCGTGLLKQIRNDLLIGFGGIAICGILPRVLVFFVDLNGYMYYFVIVVSLFTINIFYLLFICGFDEKCEWDDKPTKLCVSAITLSIILNIIALIAIIRAGMHIPDEQQKQTIITCQILFFLISLSCMAEFFNVLFGGLKLRDGVEETPRLETVRVVKNDKKMDKKSKKSTERTSKRAECMICLQKYNEVLTIPRMLKECGHTICETCADNLLRKNNGHHLLCPFCKTATVVNGTANKLPKNYGMLEMIEGQRN